MLKYQWIKAFGEPNIITKKSVKLKLEKLIENYYNHIYLKGTLLTFNPLYLGGNKMSYILKACARYFSLFSKDKCISSLFRTKYIEKKFNLVVFSSHCFTNIYSLQGYHALPASLKLLV